MDGSTALGAATTVTESLTVLHEAVSYIWGNFLEMAESLLTKPIFLVGFAIFVVGALIGLVMRVRG